MNSVSLVVFHLLLASAFRLNSAGCPGCTSPVSDPNNGEIRKLMSSTLSKTNSGYQLTDVKSCTTQVVAGIKYDCQVAIKSPNGVVSNCNLVVVQQPWMPEPERVLSESCSSVSRNKREVCAGCPVEQDAASTEIKNKLTNILSQTNSGLSLVKATSCTSQIVAGVKWVCTMEVESPKTNGVQSCEMSFLEQPWISKEPQILSDTCSKLVRNKREICAGCPIEHNGDSTEIKNKLTNILGQTNSGLSLVKAKSCTSQVVAGAKWDCVVEVESPKTNGVQTCKISFLEQPWISKEPQILSDTCSQLVRNKREICAGCPVEQDPNDPEVQKKIANTLSQTNSGVGLVGIDKCTSQVVAGILYSCTIRVDSAHFNGVETCKIEILEQPWVSKQPQVVSNTCAQLNNRAKRDLLGGLKDVDPSEKVLVQELATYAVKTLDDIDADDNKRVVTKVIRAQKQLVNGIMYYLKLQVTTTSCDEDKEINDDCFDNDNAPQKLCDIQVYRSFADKSPLNAKVVKSACEPISELKMIGGYEPVQTNGDEVQNVAKFAAKRINMMINSMYIKKIVSIEKASTQIVSGVNYDLTIVLADTTCTKNGVDQNKPCNFQAHPESNLVCQVVVYEKPWEKIMKLSSYSCKDVPNVSVQRAKRALAGGVTPADVNSADIKGLNNFLSHKLTERTNAPNLLRVVKTLSASKQVVAGMMYHVKVVVAETECPANVNTNPETCPLSNSAEEQVCEVSVWDRPWLKSREVTGFNCQKNLKLSDGGEENANDVELKRLASMLNVTMEDKNFHLFATFLSSYDKVYPSEEQYNKRFSIFRANMIKVKYLQETEQGTGIYGATEFADLTRSEFKKFHLGFKAEKGRWPDRPQAIIPNVTIPTEYDWRDYGAVTNVKNQGMCGSCWAFSITGNIEGQYAVQNKQLLSLSEQELVDCDKYDAGCNGGFFDSAFHALEDLGGLESESDYPYEGYDDKCKFNTSKVKVTISSSVNISSDETNMAKWLYKNGPISVALNANAMQFYMGGVSHPLKFMCSPSNLDHGVLIVGYGVHKTSILRRTLPYWIVKNSWGPGWGKQGYYWLYRGDGSCGINQMPTSAVL